jgi:hypothetical protein
MRTKLCGALAGAAGVGAMLAPAALATPKSFTDVGTISYEDGTAQNHYIEENLTSGGRKIGHDLLHCTMISAEADHCSATFTFSGGTVAVSGTDRNQTNNQLRIVGGTGAYRGAKGTLSLHAESGQRTVQTFAFA